MADPYRNIISDVESAIEHVSQDSNWPEKEEPCLIEKLGTWTLEKILRHDDYSSWGEWASGELRGLDEDELRSELQHFRGSGWAQMAMEWLRDDSIPAIVIVDSKKYRFTTIGDGRGRTSLAVGLGLKKLFVVELQDCPRRLTSRKG